MMIDKRYSYYIQHYCNIFFSFASQILYPFRAVQCHYKEIGKSFHNRRHVSVRMEEEGSSHYTVEFQALTYDQSGYYKSGSWVRLKQRRYNYYHCNNNI